MTREPLPIVTAIVASLAAILDNMLATLLEIADCYALISARLDYLIAAMERLCLRLMPVEGHA